MKQVHWQLELLSRQLVSLRGRVVLWWQHEVCFASRSARTLLVFCCDSFLDEWSGSVVQKALNLLVSQHEVFYFSRNFFLSMPAQQLSAAWLWSHLSLSPSEEALGVSYPYQIHFMKAKLLLVTARSLRSVAENSLVTLTRTLVPGLLLKAHDKRLLASVDTY